MCVFPRWSGHGHVHLITPPLLFSFSTCSVLLRSIFFPSWPCKRLFNHDLFSSKAQVIFTDTSAPPLPFSSWRQSLDKHHSFHSCLSLRDTKVNFKRENESNAAVVPNSTNSCVCVELAEDDSVYCSVSTGGRCLPSASQLIFFESSMLLDWHVSYSCRVLSAVWSLPQKDHA